MLKITKPVFEFVTRRKELSFKSFTFPGGEIGVKLNSQDYNFLSINRVPKITARITNSSDVLELLMAVDALRRLSGEKEVDLFMPYVPYGRQDRVCDKGESFSLKVFSELINAANFRRVIVCDPHSDVTGALFNNLTIISQFDMINKNLSLTSRIRHTILVSPDAGSNKKTAEIAKYLEHNNFVRADKLRDLATGNIKETIVYCDDFQGKDVVCIDDICDGGRTFIELAKVCKSRNCGKFILYVTHGIFSKGFQVLFNNGIDEIWTTDSFPFPKEQAANVNILELEKVFYD